MNESFSALPPLPNARKTMVLKLCRCFSIAALVLCAAGSVLSIPVAIIVGIMATDPGPTLSNKLIAFGIMGAPFLLFGVFAGWLALVVRYEVVACVTGSLVVVLFALAFIRILAM